MLYISLYIVHHIHMYIYIYMYIHTMCCIYYVLDITLYILDIVYAVAAAAAAACRVMTDRLTLLFYASTTTILSGKAFSHFALTFALTFAILPSSMQLLRNFCHLSCNFSTSIFSFAGILGFGFGGIALFSASVMYFLPRLS